MTAPRALILDTDPGIDDAIALLLALASPELRLLGVMTSHGNAPLATTTANALRILDLGGAPSVPVYPGCPRPLLRAPETAELVHGADGLGETDLPPPRLAAQPLHAVPWLIDTLADSDPESVTLCCLAPLTNLATAIVLAPEILGAVREIVIMGGAFFRGGNSTPVAEWNVLCDPHAAKIVLGCGRPITMLPLDLTHQVMTTRERLAGFAALGGPLGRFCHGALTHYDRFDTQRYGIPGTPLHDPCAVAWLLAPHLFQGKAIAVDVELTGGLTTGMTVMDWFGMTGAPANATVLHRADAEGVYRLLLERLGRLAPPDSVPIAPDPEPIGVDPSA